MPTCSLPLLEKCGVNSKLPISLLLRTNPDATDQLITENCTQPCVTAGSVNFPLQSMSSPHHSITDLYFTTTPLGSKNINTVINT